MASYQENIAWQHALQLAKDIYHITGCFPSSQRYSLADQMQRASVSIISNIAEGWGRAWKEWQRYMTIAYGSAAELEAQLILVKELGFIDQATFVGTIDRLGHILRILNHYRNKYRPGHPG